MMRGEEEQEGEMVVVVVVMVGCGEIKEVNRYFRRSPDIQRHYYIGMLSLNSRSRSWQLMISS